MPANRILEKMLDRLYVSLMKGPGLNCRPHNSRQRIDLSQLTSLEDTPPSLILPQLLTERRTCRIATRVTMPEVLRNQPFGWRTKAKEEPAIEKEPDTETTGDATQGDAPRGRADLPADETADDSQTPSDAPDDATERIGDPTSIASDGPNSKADSDNPPAGENDDKDDAHIRAWNAQKGLLTKLRNLGDDARIYEQDTGVHALAIGYPILSVPPGSTGGISGQSRRILAPIAMIPVAMQVSSGTKAGIELSCCAEGIDFVSPNAALMAWLERETGEAMTEPFDDEEAEAPWREIRALIQHAASVLEINGIDADSLAGDGFHALDTLPLAQDLPDHPAILNAAVLGLFPVSKQGLLRDTREMLEAEKLDGPVRSFLDVNVNLDAPPAEGPREEEPPVEKKTRRFADERFVTLADPCQARAVELARTEAGLVMHGPPGTGKSQTITNIIGDHLARGQRVLFVCEKRTALDVVANRLDHMGLGDFLAVVHDPQRDQRNLYMAIRARLEDLDNRKTHPRAPGRVEKIDEELQSLHDELTRYQQALMAAPDGGRSFHERMGEWLSIDSPSSEVSNLDSLRELPLDDFDRCRQDLHITLDRAVSAKYATNPWVSAAGCTLDSFLSRPMDALRQSMASLAEDARAADATIHENIPPFDATADLDGQVELRAFVAESLNWAGRHADDKAKSRMASLDTDAVKRLDRQIDDAKPFVDVLEQGTLDSELRLTVKQEQPRIAQIALDIAALERFLDSASKWWGFLAFGAKSAAVKVVKRYGVARTVTECERLKAFLVGLRARIVLSELHPDLTGRREGAAGQLVNDETLRRDMKQFARLIALRRRADSDEALGPRVCEAMVDRDSNARLIDGLGKSPPRAAALQTLEAAFRAIELFDPIWLQNAATRLRQGARASETVAQLDSQLDSIEAILRIRDTLAQLPVGFREAARLLMHESIPGDAGLDAVRKGLLFGEISKTIASNHTLQRLDSERLQNSFDRYRELEDDKRRLVRDAIEHEWVTKQKERLLVGTGSRLNSDGADLRRRLYVRGKRAMRLRQVVAVGDEIEGGDPLFDMCPIWLASPETVAQVFPRRQMFDVVIFDEASQCRLEEALPVLTRAKRIVIAGDPKQLPPTRFFEASITSSDEEAELETDQDLFEAQQGEVEDLLCAALNLQIHESYLDVHYRSANADLIGFSNEYFYNTRLQPIPGHPSRIATLPPIALLRAEGVYEDRCNPIEAQRVCDLVRDLLDRDDPPSIGIASFNLKQRDLISETLDTLACEDEAFGRNLAIARERTGEGSFEGLFVKNLENVQGDERDHIIISTTYGPTPEGKFYRRFGPLIMAGGGRRLNVLVTRARQQVHLVTSIPPDAYRHAAVLPEGKAPNGGWLLFAYLRYAERLEDIYSKDDELLGAAEAIRETMVHEKRIDPPSQFALSLAHELASEKRLSSDAHWGNAGFCIDAAVYGKDDRVDDNGDGTEADATSHGTSSAKPTKTIGVLCDFNRYPSAADAVAWEVYRLGILDWQGWQTHRVWSPQYFRDPQRILREIEGILSSKDAPNETRP